MKESTIPKRNRYFTVVGVTMDCECNTPPHLTSKILFVLAPGPHKFNLDSHAWPQNVSY